MDCIAQTDAAARRQRFRIGSLLSGVAMSAALGASLLAMTAPPDAERQAVVTAEKRPLVVADSPIKSSEQNLLRVVTRQHGLGRDFSILLNEADPATEATLRTAAAASGPEDAIEINSGLAYFRGWRPMSLGPRVKIGAEGSTMVVEVVGSGATAVERAYFVGGTSLSIELRPGFTFADGSDARPLRTPGTFFEITPTTDAKVVLVKRYALSEKPSGSEKVEPYPDAAALAKLRELVESICQRAEALNVGKDQHSKETTP